MTETAEKPNATVESRANERSPWRAKSVWLAFLLVIVGGLLWMRDSRQVAGSSAPPVGSSGFAQSSGTPAETKAAPTAPTMFRLGVSYLGGFFLGWGLRRFLKATLLVSGAAIVLIAVARKMGWVDLDWTMIESQVRESLSWIQGEAKASKAFFTGYLPSAGAAGVGAFLGFRRK